jgi:hypothetical protein
MNSRAAVAGLLTLFVCSLSFAYESSHLEQFKILQCNSQTKNCFAAKGELGFVSLRSNSLVGSNIQLEITSSGLVQKQRLCSQFRFDFDSQFLTCDNRDLPHGELITLDSNFQLSTILLSEKRI